MHICLKENDRGAGGWYNGYEQVGRQIRRKYRMGFWVYMLIMDLLLPFGYRTSMSMKNKDTWKFAHKYCGKIWYVCGLVMLPLTVILFLALIGKSQDCVGTAGGIIMGIQLVPLLGSIIPTEMALRKHFDISGKRR